MLNEMSSNIEVTTTHKDQSNYNIIVDSIINYLSTEKLNDSLAENYTKERLDLNNTLAISTIKEDNNVIGFSTLLYRNLFGNAVRCLNRFYKSPHYRFATSIKNVTPETKEMIQQQSDIAEQLQYDVIFMSRETSKHGKTSLRHYPQKFLHDWIVSPNFHLVCDNETSIRCWQTVIYKKLNTNAVLKLKSITPEEFKNGNYKIR